MRKRKKMRERERERKWNQYLETPKQAQLRLAAGARDKGQMPECVSLPTPAQTTVNDYHQPLPPRNEKNHKHKHKEGKKQWVRKSPGIDD